MAIWNNTALAPNIGVYHSSEIPLVFRVTEQRPNATKDVPEETKLSALMRCAWATFAKVPEGGLENLQWPVYNPDSTTLIQLDYGNQSAVNLTLGEQKAEMSATAYFTPLV